MMMAGADVCEQQGDFEEMDVDEEDHPHDGHPHPLLIDHVVENISRYLLQDEQDHTVLQSRLVCQVWDKIVTKSLRFHSNRTVYFGKYFRRPEALLEFCHYLQHSSSLDHFPVGKFYLCEDVFQHNHLHTVQTFFLECATLLTSLSIRLDNQSDLKVSDMNFVELAFPNLKTLILDDRRILNGTRDTDGISPSTFLEGLVTKSPSLEKLTVIHPASSMFDDEETASNRRLASEHNVAWMLRESCPKYLSYLNLDIKFNDKVLVTLSAIPARLQELQLSLRESEFSKEALHKLLESQKESLRAIRLCSMGTKSHFEITFPVLPSLTLLELHSWDAQVQGVTMSRFSYQDYFPSLKNLILHTWAENPGWIQFFPAAYYGTVPSITGLKLPQNFMYPAMIQNLSWLYPNLKRLDVQFSKETLIIIQRVFSHFSDSLEELKIRNSLPREKCDFCLDPLFTGLSQSVCESILRRRMFDPRPQSNPLLKLRDKPSLLNLKSLRKLDIEDMLRHETYVTDVTGYLVLLQMPSLRYLLMGRSQIDDECLGHLAKKYPCTMERELSVPKPSPQRMLLMTKKTSVKFFLAGAGSSVRDAYNFCLSSMDLASTCVIM